MIAVVAFLWTRAHRVELAAYGEILTEALVETAGGQAW